MDGHEAQSGRRRAGGVVAVALVAVVCGGGTVLSAGAATEPEPQPVFLVAPREPDELPPGVADAAGLAATDPVDGQQYVVEPDTATVVALDDSGDTEAVYDLRAAGVEEPQSLAVAPSADSTDDPTATNLFVGDADGQVLELTLDEPVFAALSDPSVLVQSIDASAWVPAAPDTSGIVYMPDVGSFMVSDSEVDEPDTGAGYNGVNLWQIDGGGTVLGTGTTVGAFSVEPTGVGYRQSDRALLVSDDNTNRITFVRPGADGRHGTADDTRTQLNTPFSDDPEDVAYDSRSNSVWICDGVDAEVYRVSPGGDGDFGTGDDVVTQFDVGVHGAIDPEGIAYDSERDTLWIVDQRSHAAYELAKSGELIRTVEIRPTDSEAIAGIEIAPSSVQPGRRNIWLVDRGVDNGVDSTENDGRVYELSVDFTENTPPVVNRATITPAAPLTNDVLSVVVDANDEDDDPIELRYQWRRGGVAIPDQISATVDLAVPGNGDKGDVISVRVVAFDGIVEGAPRTSGQVTIGDSPPVFGQDLRDRTDGEGDTVSFAAPAVDPDGDALTYGATGLPAGIAISTSTGLVSGTIGSDAADDSPYAVTIAVHDGLSVDASDTFRWTVTPGAPPPSTSTTTSTTDATTPPPPPPPPATRSGYWMVDGAGTVYAFGGVGALGNAGSGSVTDIEPTAAGDGYWIVDAQGRVFAFGTAEWRGNADASALAPGEFVVSMSATPNGGGYWLFTNRGRVLAFGSAGWFGDLANLRLNGPVIASIATPTGIGYYLVASDGGVFAFGDARFYGSMGGTRLNQPVVGLVPDGDGAGYWLVASDGGVFAFDAPFRGSMGGTPLNRPVIGLLRYGNGYLMVASDGGIFVFSDKPFSGSLGGNPPSRPIVNAAAI